MPSRLTVFITVLILSIVATVPVQAHEGTIVILHSYHQGYEWTDAVNKGIMTASGGSNMYDLAYEYFDAKRSTDTTHAAFADTLEKRYSGRKIAAVIVVDDDALRFILPRRNKLFGEAPIVACGINDLKTYNTFDLAGIYGITESPDIRGTIQLALSIFPETTTIFAVSDNTLAGMINMGRFDRAIVGLPATIDIKWIVAPEEDVLDTTLRNLPPNSIVMYLSWLRTNSGHNMTVRESVSHVVRSSPAPVFGCWDFIVAAGAFGGRVVSGFRQGQTAATIVLQLINRTGPSSKSAASESIRSEVDYENQVDYSQLGRFGRTRFDLPPDTVLLNAPQPLPNEVQLLLTGLVLLVLAEAATLAVVLQGRRSIKAAETRYRMLAERLPAIVYSVALGPPARTVYISPRLKTMLGYEPQAWMENIHAWSSNVHPEDRDRVIASVSKADSAYTPDEIEYRIVRADGTVNWMRNMWTYYTDAHGKWITLGVMFDATQEHASRQALQAALTEKELLLREVHHRVKNNFQVISSLLHLETERTHDSHSREALAETEHRILAMSLVHERLYESGDFGHIDVTNYASRLGEELARAAMPRTPVLFGVEGDTLTLGLDDAVPVGLFLNEAITNAYKYAFPASHTGERRIRVVIASTTDGWSVSVADTGVGAPATLVTTPPESTTSLGLTLMRLLAQQIGGEFGVESDGGLTVSIRVDLRHS